MHWFEHVVYFSAGPMVAPFVPLWLFRLLMLGLFIFPLDGHHGTFRVLCVRSFSGGAPHGPALLVSPGGQLTNPRRGVKGKCEWKVEWMDGETRWFDPSPTMPTTSTQPTNPLQATLLFGVNVN